VGRQASPGICEDAGGPIAGEHYAIAAHCVEGTMAVLSCVSSLDESKIR
jgi:hypothetical protein